MAENREFNEYVPELYTFEDEQGQKHVFEMLDSITQNGNEYFAMIPYFENPGELLDFNGEPLIMRAYDENGEKFFAVVDDEEELVSVLSDFAQSLSEKYDFCDDECDCCAHDECDCCGHDE